MAVNKENISSEVTEFISESGDVLSYDVIQQVAVDHNDTTDLSDPPITLNGESYHPVIESAIYTITYTFAGKEQIDIATDITLIEPTSHTQTTPNSVLEFTFITRQGKVKRELTHNNIHQVKINEDPHKVFTTPEEPAYPRARKLEKYAEHHPYLVSPAQIIPLLTHNNSDAVRCAVSALRHIISTRPDDCQPATHSLKQLIESTDNKYILQDALHCVLTLAEFEPKQIITFAEPVSEYQTHSHPNIRENALKILLKITPQTNILPHIDIDALIAQVKHSTTDTSTLTSKVLSAISDQHPEKFATKPSDLLTIYTATNSNETQVAIMSILSHVTRYDPNVVIGSIDFIASEVDSSNPRISGNAVSVLYHLASEYPDDVACHIDSIVTAYGHSSDYLTLNVSATLSRLAATHPQLISKEKDTLVRALDSTNDKTRLNAVSAFDIINSTSDVDLDIDAERINEFIESESQSEAISRGISVHNSLTK